MKKTSLVLLTLLFLSNTVQAIQVCNNDGNNNNPKILNPCCGSIVCAPKGTNEYFCNNWNVNDYLGVIPGTTENPNPKNDRVIIRWDQSEDGNDAQRDKFVIWYREMKPDSFWKVAYPSTGIQKYEYSLLPLLPDTTYEWKMMTIAIDSHSNNSEEVECGTFTTASSTQTPTIDFPLEYLTIANLSLSKFILTSIPLTLFLLVSRRMGTSKVESSTKLPVRGEKKRLV